MDNSKGKIKYYLFLLSLYKYEIILTSCYITFNILIISLFWTLLYGNIALAYILLATILAIASIVYLISFR